MSITRGSNKQYEKITPIPMTQEEYKQLTIELEQKEEALRKAMYGIEEDKASLLNNEGTSNAEGEIAVLANQIVAIRRKLQNSYIIEKPTFTDEVMMGVTVKILQTFGPDKTTEKVFTIASEGNIAQGILGYQSPLAQALMGKTTGEEATYQTPTGEAVATILNISIVN